MQLIWLLNDFEEMPRIIKPGFSQELKGDTVNGAGTSPLTISQVYPHDHGMYNHI